jgi:hypothetical protein
MEMDGFPVEELAALGAEVPRLLLDFVLGRVVVVMRPG